MTESYYCLATNCDKPRTKKWVIHRDVGANRAYPMPSRYCNDHIMYGVTYFNSIEAAQLHIAKESL